MKYCFVYNPRAGSVRSRSAFPAQLRAFIATHRLDAVVSTTTHPGHATDLALAGVAAGADIVVAVGGDGTVNEVARALVDTPATLGLIPRGSGNGLARSLRIPLEPAAAHATLLTGRPRLIDAGEANGRLFFCAMGVGFDAAVLARFERLPRRGFLAYLFAAAGLFFSYRCDSYALCIGDRSAPSQPALLIAVVNSDQLGNSAYLAPGASIDDGRLDLIRVPPVSLFSALPRICRLFTGRLRAGIDVDRFSGEHFLITRPAPGAMHVDGELVDTTAEVSVLVRPACLRVLAPEDTPTPPARSSA